MKKIGFVVQRCGKEVNGGSELHCLQYAKVLAENYDVEILTTCALDYQTWEDHYPAGEEIIADVVIRRFPVDSPRNLEQFSSLSRHLYDHIQDVSREEQEAWLYAQGPNSSQLETYIIENQQQYDKFIFFTYLYLPYFLLPHVQKKAILVPTAHDEWPIYMNIWDDFFSLPAGFIFNTIEEVDFLKKRFPDLSFTGPVIGNGVARPDSVNPLRFRERFSLADPFLLYTGRIDEGKGCRQLFDYFIELRKTEAFPRKLVLMGKAAMEIPEHPDIVSLGFVNEQVKWDGMSAADWLINPSPHESLSIVLLEAWLTETPTLVTDQCAVLVGQSKRSNGGLWYNNFMSFKYIAQNVDIVQRKKMGAQGKLFVHEKYTWEKISGKLREVIDGVS